jgi:drug/metabolite transporter (DMT)-like permease
VTIQRGTLSIRPRFKQTSQKLPAGVLTALAASFFYSFGAVADKLGVMTGDILIYTFHLSLYMLIFHLARVIWQHQTLRVLSEIKHNPKSLLLGGMIMLLSFISFRLGLEEAQASYASALRQVSTLFGIAIGFLVFKEKVGLNRIISSMIIVAGAILIKIG